MTTGLGLLAPVAAGEARGEVVLQRSGNNNSVPTLGHTLFLSLGRGAALSFPESDRVPQKLFLQLHHYIILIFLPSRLIKQSQTAHIIWLLTPVLSRTSSNSGWISKLTPTRVRNIYFFLSMKTLQQSLQAEAQLSNTPQTQTLTLWAKQGSSNSW